MVETLLSIGMLSTHPPTQCGLATFNAALWAHLDAPGGAASVVRVVEGLQPAPGPEVVTHLVNGDRRSAAAAVEELNRHDAVVVQHEYGIYGGPDGSDVLEVLRALTAPSIVVLHTVLENPSARQRYILEQILVEAHVVVTMTETARQRLVRRYGADPAGVVVVPHGAVGPGVLRPRVASGRSRPLILTWGLLGPGKGIEWAIDALPGLRDLEPEYLVVGRTHPKVLEHHGDTYREGLVQRAAALGVQDLLRFDDSYRTVEDLADLAMAADVVLLPYDSRDQVTSGVLVEAVAAGRPVVSTAFPHAVELLADELGLVVPQADPVALEGALRRVLSEPGLAESMAAKAADRAPALLWSAVARQYRGLADTLVAAACAAAP